MSSRFFAIFYLIIGICYPKDQQQKDFKIGDQKLNLQTMHQKSGPRIDADFNTTFDGNESKIIQDEKNMTTTVFSVSTQFKESKAPVVTNAKPDNKTSNDSVLSGGDNVTSISPNGTTPDPDTSLLKRIILEYLRNRSDGDCFAKISFDSWIIYNESKILCQCLQDLTHNSYLSSYLSCCHTWAERVILDTVKLIRNLKKSGTNLSNEKIWIKVEDVFEAERPARIEMARCVYDMRSMTLNRKSFSTKIQPDFFIEILITEMLVMWLFC